MQLQSNLILSEFVFLVSFQTVIFNSGFTARKGIIILKLTFCLRLRYKTGPVRTYFSGSGTWIFKHVIRWVSGKDYPYG